MNFRPWLSWYQQMNYLLDFHDFSCLTAILATTIIKSKMMIMILLTLGSLSNVMVLQKTIFVNNGGNGLEAVSAENVYLWTLCKASKTSQKFIDLHLTLANFFRKYEDVQILSTIWCMLKISIYHFYKFDFKGWLNQFEDSAPRIIKDVYICYIQEH